MDIFKPYLGRGKVTVTYSDGTVGKVEITSTLPKLSYASSFPYSIVPGKLIDGENKSGYFCLYSPNGNCYYRGHADIVSIGGAEQTTDLFKSFVGKRVIVIFQGSETPHLVTVRNSESTEHPYIYPYIYPYILEDDPNILLSCNQTGLCVNGERVSSVREVDQYKDVLKGLAEILVSAGPDDDKSDLVEEIREHMDTHCREIMDEVQCKQDDEVEKLKEQIKQLDSAAYGKLIEQLHLHRI